MLSILPGEVTTLQAAGQRDQSTLDCTLCRKAKELVGIIQGPRVH